MRLLLIVILGGLTLVGCTAAATPAPMSGEQVLGALQSSGLPVQGAHAFTADSDPNKLLGRPDQYTAKVSWFDTRVSPQDDLNIATIEVFPDAASLEARYKYTDGISKSAGAFAQYIYRNDGRRLLLRLPHALTPAQADEYKAWLATL